MIFYGKLYVLSDLIEMSTGRRYDENGNLRQWWSNDTLVHYHEKVECIIKQYSNYHLPELGNNFTVNILFYILFKQIFKVFYHFFEFLTKHVFIKIKKSRI